MPQGQPMEACPEVDKVVSRLHRWIRQPCMIVTFYSTGNDPTKGYDFEIARHRCWVLDA